jgi:hypothetical protein
MIRKEIPDLLFATSRPGYERGQSRVLTLFKSAPAFSVHLETLCQVAAAEIRESR